MRGNRRCLRPMTACRGSIPAHAGEPHRSPSLAARFRVYPRACGGTQFLIARLEPVQGLSPRMRGNPEHRNAGRLPLGSIPAHAGEPHRPRIGQRVVRVYPRACGGTKPWIASTSHAAGLSPRMRGNLFRRAGIPQIAGSIPAHAGEPFSFFIFLTPLKVYPRACGGTVSGQLFGIDDQGLSPRMRGNRVRASGSGQRSGSIPAHAGEPRVHLRLREEAGVYPRACGGTLFLLDDDHGIKGLSPRMRGNLCRSI